MEKCLESKVDVEEHPTQVFRGKFESPLLHVALRYLEEKPREWHFLEIWL